MTYYNSHNTDGLSINGSPDDDRDFDETYSRWEAVKGPTGTYLRGLEMHNNFADWTGHYDAPPEEYMKMWFYDNEEPSDPTGGDEGVALFPNRFSLCTNLLNNQVTTDVRMSG